MVARHARCAIRDLDDYLKSSQMDNKIGIILTRDVSLAVDWGNLSQNFATLIGKGAAALTGDFTSGMEALGALIGMSQAVKRDVPPGARALELIVLCFASAFDKIRKKTEVTRTEVDFFIDSIAKFKDIIHAEAIVIQHDFFTYPSSSAPYKILRDTFISERNRFRKSSREDISELTFRFDAAFREAVFGLSITHTSLFDELSIILDSPSARAADFDRQWQIYRTRLIYEFH